MKQPSRRQPPRHGAVLFVALACLLIVMSILGSMLQGALRARRQLRVEHDARQVECLVQAGLDRAAYRLRREAGYRRETWELKIGHNAAGHDAQVVIEASHAADDAPWKVQVRAEYPFGDEHSIRRSRTFLVSATTNPTQE